MITDTTTYERHTKRLVWSLFWVGIGFALMIAVFVTEYSLILAEMSLIQEKLDLSIEQMVGDGSIPAYILAMIFWTILLGGVVGWVWGRVLTPSLDRIEKFILGLVLGVFVMPMSFVIPALIVSVRKLYSDWFGAALPDYYGQTVENIVVMFAGTQEQSYELFNVLVFILLGLLLLLGKYMYQRSRSTAEDVPGNVSKS